MKFKKQSMPTRSEQREVLHLTNSIMATGERVGRDQALTIAQMVLNVTKGWPDRDRRRLVFRSVK